jgi:hypothetical protein
MYEMKGASSGRADPGPPGHPGSPVAVGWLPSRSLPVGRLPGRPAPCAPAGVRHPPGKPGLPAIPALRGKPRMVPVSSGECISTPSAPVAQEPAGIHFPFFCVHTLSTELRRLSAGHSGYPRLYAQLIHRLPDVRKEYQLMLALCNRLLFSWQRPANHESRRHAHPAPGRKTSDALKPHRRPGTRTHGTCSRALRHHGYHRTLSRPGPRTSQAQRHGVRTRPGPDATQLDPAAARPEPHNRAPAPPVPLTSVPGPAGNAMKPRFERVRTP